MTSHWLAHFEPTGDTGAGLIDRPATAVSDCLTATTLWHGLTLGALRARLACGLAGTLLQPAFGRRLKRLRTERGLSQSALGGVDISAGYLSRLESGARTPTPRVTHLLAERLGVRLAELVGAETPDLATVLAEFHSAARPGPEQPGQIGRAMFEDLDADPAVRWQALWALVEREAAGPDANPDLATLGELVEMAEKLDSPTLLCRSEALYSRWLRVHGHYAEASYHARRGLAAAERVTSAADQAQALQSLIAAEGDQGHLPEAHRLADRLLDVVAGEGGAILTEALWSNATVRVLEGNYEDALSFLRRAVDQADARDGPSLWFRVHVAAASLHLQLDPPDPASARELLARIKPVIGLLAEPRQLQEHRAVRSHLAFAEGDIAGATAIAEEMLSDPQCLLTHRDRVRLSSIPGRAMIVTGDRERGVRHLKQLARESAPGTLSMEIYRILANTLAGPWDQDADAGNGP